jgi:energy-coupling factor transporter ATP-binding protein EcfA2
MATATEHKPIQLENIGAIEKLALPVPADGGVIVIKGRNGSGKSTAISATESLVTGKSKPEVRDGALNGKVSGLGVTMTVGRSKRITGELEVTSLEGRLSPAELVDPGIKDPDAADSKRIKALVALVGAEADISLFAGLIDEPLDNYVSTSATEADDLLVMTARIKRDFESKARDLEDREKNYQGKALAARESAAGVDLTADCDGDKLHRQLEQAISAESALRTRKAEYDRASKANQQAREQLEKARSEYSGKSLDEAMTDELRCKQSTEEASSNVANLEKLLAEARVHLANANHFYSAAIAARKAAESHTRSLAEWEKQLEAAMPEPVSTDAILEAAEQVQTARDACDLGVKVRSAKEQIAKADEHLQAAKTAALKAKKLREAAKGTDEVLSQVVAKTGSQLRVEAGRLVLDTKRGATYFADLSHGERWKIALDIAIEAVGPGGLLTIPQEAWESLDPINRKLIAEHVAGSGVVLITAEADAGELRGELFS